VIIFVFLVKRAIKGPREGIARLLLIPFLIGHGLKCSAMAMEWYGVASIAAMFNFAMYIMIILWFVMIYIID